MRFASVSLPKAEPQRSPATEFVRRLLTGEKPPPQPLSQEPCDPLPADLDQRVRLVGEW
jgi:hypothetical protein